MNYEIVVLGPEAEKDPADCLRGLVQTIVDYTAKQITTCLDIISETYGHSREDLADLLRNDKKLDMSLKKEMGLIIEKKSTSGRKVIIKKQKPKVPEPS